MYQSIKNETFFVTFGIMQKWPNGLMRNTGGTLAEQCASFTETCGWEGEEEHAKMRMSMNCEGR